MPTERNQLLTLKRQISQAELVLSSEGGEARCRELLGASSSLVSDLLKEQKMPAAALLGSKSGSVTAKRGSEYFRQLAAKRKTNAGGRPRKEV
jgi:hypothetical protein